MVQLTNSVLVAAVIVAPTLASHLGDVHHETLHARDPRLSALIKKVGRNTPGAISTAATVAGAAAALAPAQTVARDLEELEELAARDPKLGAILKKVGRNTSSALGMAATVGGAAAALVPPPTQRELDALEVLAAREPIFGKILRVAKKVAGGAAQVAAGALSGRDFEAEVEFTARDIEMLEELAEREPIFGKAFRAIKKVAGGAAQVAAGALAGRDVEEFQEFTTRARARRPQAPARGRSTLSRVASKLTNPDTLNSVAQLSSNAVYLHQAHQANKFAKQEAAAMSATPSTTEATQYTAREFEEEFGLTAREMDTLEELVLREPIFGKVLRVAKKVAGGAVQVAAGALSGREYDDVEEFTARELEIMDELEARDPFLGKIFRKVKGFFKGKSAAAAAAEPAAEEQQPAAREYDDFEEFTVRDLELMDELEARNPFLGKIFRKVKGFFKGKAAAAPAAQPAAEEQPVQRDLENVEELAGREYYYDELD
ncbi:unnamed protein product [Cyclocybe aegerita]|uniref:Uncharacterized protein n=1 Tax=Cyclocybe aegerita TaxID=1973307 RepID=A0A8S0XRS9_CYCAE|nr:unnamed protein product [Cyclocybe aegerita]